MGLKMTEYIHDTHKVVCCIVCRTHLSKVECIVSKKFIGQHGAAYLYSDVVNYWTGKEEERIMTTGRHVVTDVFCARCHSNVGWKYITAYEEEQKYKEGKFILERACTTSVHPHLATSLLSEDILTSTRRTFY